MLTRNKALCQVRQIGGAQSLSLHLPSHGPVTALHCDRSPVSNESFTSVFTIAKSSDGGSPGVKRARSWRIEGAGGWSASNQKLNIVDQRRAWAFGLVAKGIVDQVRVLGVEAGVQSSVA